MGEFAVRPVDARFLHGQRTLVIGRFACLGTLFMGRAEPCEVPVAFSEFIQVYCTTGQLISAMKRRLKKIQSHPHLIDGGLAATGLIAEPPYSTSRCLQVQPE
ncbi:hypothetical protein [Streptomyces graminilatus]|uniref:hypothetical protein n=1 Tax=Streptomyces graminilatus TaxID=1464070 RepID=UPI0012FECE76|nr:hypothetical protein [Streptomyces graminilatus]